MTPQQELAIKIVDLHYQPSGPNKGDGTLYAVFITKDVKEWAEVHLDCFIHSDIYITVTNAIADLKFLDVFGNPEINAKSKKVSRPNISLILDDLEETLKFGCAYREGDKLVQGFSVDANINLDLVAL